MYKNKRHLLILLTFIFVVTTALAQQWPEAGNTAKAGARWWWLGSAVDTTNLKWCMRQYADHGIGALEITPIYGVQGNDANNISYLSPKWMEMLKFVEDEGQRDGIEIDMNNGTGWPFGGPWVPMDEAACKAVFVDTIVNAKRVNVDKLNFILPKKERDIAKLQCVKLFPTNDKKQWRVIALYISRTLMQVKRAAPGGEGYVIDHFDRNAVKHYLDHFDKAFADSHTPYPSTFFNDSYEVDRADWTPTLLDEFRQRRGYNLEDCFDKLLDGDAKTVSDYRETLSDMLLANFTQQWTAWAHSHGVLTRNQAHGSPANLIDCYAAVDIPEIEGFGLSELGIKGLRRDAGHTRTNYSDLSMLKYASSAAHITGKRLTSCETCTWLTEHFRTSLSQMKPDIDLIFCSGANRILFHGTAYSPKDEAWPGWKFYAAVDMSPTNSIWRDASFLTKYIERCQSFLQWGQADNDFLVYLPVRDMWRTDTKRLLMMFEISNMKKKSPQFVQSVLKIDSLGFDCDYISEKYLLSTSFKDGMLVTAAGTRYKGLIIPCNNVIKENVKTHIDSLKSLGANIIYGVDEKAMNSAARPEQMKTLYGLKMIRRSNDKGYHYFISNLTPNDVKGAVSLAVNSKAAMWFNPLNGERYKAEYDDGKLQINLRSGESMILETFSDVDAGTLKQLSELDIRKDSPYDNHGKKVSRGWRLNFIESVPEIKERFDIDSLRTWEGINDSTRILMGTGVYTTYLRLTKDELKGSNSWMIDLGDVRESARVYINGQFIGCAWCVPYLLQFNNLLKPGLNTIRIEVTNLPANRISDLDRKGVKWRRFNEINFVDVNYKKTSYADWAPVASGLNSRVLLYRVK
jgi:hypothetical protein